MKKQLQYLNSPEQEDHFFVMRMKIQNPRQIFFRWWLPKFLQLENLNIRKSKDTSSHLLSPTEIAAL